MSHGRNCSVTVVTHVSHAITVTGDCSHNTSHYVRLPSQCRPPMLQHVILLDYGLNIVCDVWTTGKEILDKHNSLDPILLGHTLQVSSGALYVDWLSHIVPDSVN